MTDESSGANASNSPQESRRRAPVRRTSIAGVSLFVLLVVFGVIWLGVRTLLCWGSDESVCEWSFAIPTALVVSVVATGLWSAFVLFRHAPESADDRRTAPVRTARRVGRGYLGLRTAHRSHIHYLIFVSATAIGALAATLIFFLSGLPPLVCMAIGAAVAAAGWWSVIKTQTHASTIDTAEALGTIKLEPPVPLPQLPADTPGPSSDCKRTALIVVHGMGQQMPFETLNDIVDLLRPDEEENCEAVSAIARFVRIKKTGGDVLLPRVSLDPANGTGRGVDVYEVYWAPFTEGAISFTETMMFFLATGVRAVGRACISRQFGRWLFGEFRVFTVPVLTMLRLAAATLALAALFAVLILFPAWLGSQLNWSEWEDAADVVHLAYYFVVVGSALYLLRRTRDFVRQYFGDVAIYVNSNEVDRFYEIRQKIKSASGEVVNAVLGAVVDGPTLATEGPGGAKLAYDRICVAGHSLGSVVAYDLINAAINRDLSDESRLRAHSRIHALITFGSPLDKTAYIFRHQSVDRPMRELLASGVQPLIQNYEWRPRKWINIWARMDIFSGPLDFYDIPRDPSPISVDAVKVDNEHGCENPADTGDLKNEKDRRVQNRRDPEASWWSPPKAHTGYWKHEVLRKALSEATMEKG